MTINLTRFYYDPLEVPQDETTKQESSSSCSLPACQACKRFQQLLKGPAGVKLSKQISLKQL